MGKTLAALFSAARNNINTLLPSRRQNAEETADQ
jgi:hypothetical protein